MAEYAVTVGDASGGRRAGRLRFMMPSNKPCAMNVSLLPLVPASLAGIMAILVSFSFGGQLGLPDAGPRRRAM